MGKIRPDYRALRFEKRALRFEKAKKWPPRKGGGEARLGLILRGKEYHQGHNPVNNYFSEKNVEILRGEVLFHAFYQHNFLLNAGLRLALN